MRQITLQGIVSKEARSLKGNGYKYTKSENEGLPNSPNQSSIHNVNTDDIYSLPS